VAEGLDRYRLQHRELQLTVKALAKLLDHEHLSSSATAARSMVSHLAERLAQHIDAEDRLLYPELLASADPTVRQTAAGFQAVNADLKAKADAFFTAWLQPNAIVADTKGFAGAARRLLHLVTERIAAEECELFPLVDRRR
jgi:hypothetical protein